MDDISEEYKLYKICKSHIKYNRTIPVYRIILNNENILNLIDNKGRNLLFLSVMAKNYKLVRFILRINPIQRANIYGVTPIIVSVINKYDGILKLLLENKPNFDVDHYKKSALHYAAVYNRYNMAKLLISYGIKFTKCKNGNTPLHYAVIYNNIKINFLIKRSFLI